MTKEEKDKMVQENMRLVGYCIRHTNIPKCFNKEDYEDLEQDGLVGLIKAVNRYDSKKVFSTYAVPCIKRELWKTINQKMKTYSNCVEFLEEYTNVPEPQRDDFDMIIDSNLELTRDEKVVLTMKYKYNLTLQDAADFLRCTRSNAGRLHLRALKKLKKGL